MIECTVDQNRGAFVALTSEVGKRFVPSDRLLGRRVHRIEQPALVIFARQPLNQAVVVSRKGGQLPREKSVYIILPSRRRNGDHRSVLFRCSRRRRRLRLNSSYGQPLEQSILKKCLCAHRQLCIAFEPPESFPQSFAQTGLRAPAKFSQCTRSIEAPAR